MRRFDPYGVCVGLTPLRSPYGVLSSARQVLTFVFDKFFQGWNDLREVDTDSVPDDLGADQEIFMNDHVSDTFHFLPGNFRI